MPTQFLTGQATDVKPYTAGTARENRYAWVNSRNHNLKVVRSGSGIATQNLGIASPIVAPTGTAGTGGNLYYKYVYVNKFYTNPLALEPDPYIRSNASPVLEIASVGSAATDLIATASSDTQVTHIWFYVSDSSTGFFYRVAGTYEVVNTGTPTLATGVTAVDTAQPLLEVDNYVPDTCRIVEEINGWYNYGGFVAMDNTGSVESSVDTPPGQSVVTTDSTVYDGSIGLYLQFVGDATGGPYGNGIHIANYASANTLQLVNIDGTNRIYDGAASQVSGSFRLWRPASTIQLSKRYNPDAIPGVIDADYLIPGPGDICGIAKPNQGFSARYHYNTNGKKSVWIADFSQGLPPRLIQTSSPYSMANPRAYDVAGNNIFYYDAQAGIIQDTGMNHNPVTQKVIPNLMRSLNPTSATSAEMVFDEYRNLLFLSCAPNGYTKNYYLIVYNLTSNTFNLWFMLPDVLCMRKIYASNGIPLIYMGSSNGSVTTWPSNLWNEAVGGLTLNGMVASATGTTITTAGLDLPTSGDSLIDRWVMTWNDADDVPVYQFARIASNTIDTMTLDTFICPYSSTSLSPVPSPGDSFWVGPIQSILGPAYDFNAIPDEDGQFMDLSLTQSGLDESMNSRISLYRNMETTPAFEMGLKQNIYNDQTNDPYHQSFKSASPNGVETTGVTGWKITDNNESPLSIKSLVKRIRRTQPKVRQPFVREG